MQRIRNKCDAVHNELNPSRVKAHFNHHLFEKNPLNTTIKFAYIEFKSHVYVFFSRLWVGRVKDFMGYKNIIFDQLIRNKSTLGRKNYLVENPFESISQHLDNDFINNITHADTSEVPNFE